MPGDPDDSQSRYIETNIDGIVIGCLYLPNGNPAAGPKFDYKLQWFERLTKNAKGLVALDQPVILAGDYNVIPTELDAYKPERWVDDVCTLRRPRPAVAARIRQRRRRPRPFDGGSIRCWWSSR